MITISSGWRSWLCFWTWKLCWIQWSTQWRGSLAICQGCNWCKGSSSFLSSKYWNFKYFRHRRHVWPPSFSWKRSHPIFIMHHKLLHDMFSFASTNNVNVSLQCATADPDGQKRALVIGGGIANFTDVAATFNGIIRALKEKVTFF